MDTEGEDEGSSEEGEGIVNEILPSVDPITKGPLKDPVRNKYCGHIYGRATITEYIKSRKTKYVFVIFRVTQYQHETALR